MIKMYMTIDINSGILTKDYKNNIYKYLKNKYENKNINNIGYIKNIVENSLIIHSNTIEHIYDIIKFEVEFCMNIIHPKIGMKCNVKIDKKISDGFFCYMYGNIKIFIPKYNNINSYNTYKEDDYINITINDVKYESDKFCCIADVDE